MCSIEGIEKEIVIFMTQFSKEDILNDSQNLFSSLKAKAKEQQGLAMKAMFESKGIPANKNYIKNIVDKTDVDEYIKDMLQFYKERIKKYGNSSIQDIVKIDDVYKYMNNLPKLYTFYLTCRLLKLQPDIYELKQFKAKMEEHLNVKPY